MKTKDQIRRELVGNIQVLNLMKLIEDDDSVINPEVRDRGIIEVEARIEMLNWVLDNEPFNAEEYGA